MNSDKRTVIVEDDFLIADFLADLCRELGAEVVGMASRADEALKVITEARPEFVLTDVRLPGGRDGVDLANDVFGLFPGIRIIFVTGSSEPRAIDRLGTDHPYQVLIKPVDSAALRKAFA